MKKHLKKRYLRILNYLLLFAALILLLIFLFGFLDDLLNKLDILIKKTHVQANQIHMLENEIHSLETSNARLENVVANQHQQIQELKVSGNTITVDLRPKEVIVPDDLHKEIEPQLHNEVSIKDMISNPTVIVATILSALTMVKGTVGTLLPTLP